MTKHKVFHVDCPPENRCAIDRRALSRWPGIDRQALANCRHDPDRIARLITRSTSLPEEDIQWLLGLPGVTIDEVDIWFG